MPIIDINTQFGAYPARHRTSTYDSLAAESITTGVDLCCACSTVGIFFNYQEGNIETSHAASNATQLVPVATINPAMTIDPEQAVAEIDSYTFKMVRFFPDIQGWPIDFAPFTQILKLLVQRSLPVMISATRLGDATQIARTVNAIGGSVPIILEGTNRETLSEAVAAVRECAALVLETHSLGLPDALPRLRDIVGSERIVFGSGASALSLNAALGYVRGAGLETSEMNQILGGNAAMLLKIG